MKVVFVSLLPKKWWKYVPFVKVGKLHAAGYSWCEWGNQRDHPCPALN